MACRGMPQPYSRMNFVSRPSLINKRGHLIRGRYTRRQFHDFDVAKVDLRSFGFEAKISLSLRGAADSIYEFAVDREFDNAVHRDNVIRVPLSPPFATIFDGLASLASRIIRRCLHTADAKQLAMHIRDGRRDSVVFVQLGPLQFEHLNFDAVRQPAGRIRTSAAPRKYAGVPTRLDVRPLDMQDEVLVLLHTAHYADRMAGADQHAVFDSPGIFGGIDVHPAGQVLDVKQAVEFRSRNFSSRKN